MIPVYKSEYELGLAEEIIKNDSIAYHCQIRKVDQDCFKNIDLTKLDHPSLAKASNKDDWDLYWLNSVLVSIGWNANDDVFDPAETWIARSSPVNKQFNYMHDEKDIIGHMVASIAVDEDENIIDNNIETLPERFDIVVSSVLYRHWSDPNLQSRMDDIIEGIANDEWFVSMECLFRNFDYAVIRPDGQHDIIPRTSASAFLTKHLRRYGGSGEFEGNKLGRLLRNFTFSGKGLVTNPANKRSVIFNNKSKAFIPQLVIAENKAKSENKMENSEVISQLRSDLAARDAEVTKANSRVESVEKKLNEMVEAARTEEKVKLEKQIADLNTNISDQNNQIKELKDSVASKDSELGEAKTKADELQKELDEAKKTLANVEKEKLSANRVSELVNVGVDKEKAEEVVKKWADATDEQFTDIVSLHAEMDKKNKDKKNKPPKDEESTADVNSLDDTELDDDDVDLGVSDANESEERVKSATAFIVQFLRCSNNESE